MNNTHLDSTSRYPACKLNGANLWHLDLAHLVERRFGKPINAYTVFDAREYDSYEDAKAALLEMESLGIYEIDYIPTYTIKHTNGDLFTGTYAELMKFFDLKSKGCLNNFLEGKVNTNRYNRYSGWRVI